MPALTFGLDFDDPCSSQGYDYLTADEFWDFGSWTVFAVVQAKTEKSNQSGQIISDYGEGFFADRYGLFMHAGSGNPGGLDDGWAVHAKSNVSNPLVHLYGRGGTNVDVQLEILTGALDATASGTVFLWSRDDGLLGTETNANYLPTTATSGTGDPNSCLGRVCPPTIADNSGWLNGSGIRGHLQELILYDSKLSDTNRLAVEDYLEAKYISGSGPPSGFTWDQDTILNNSGRLTNALP